MVCNCSIKYPDKLHEKIFNVMEGSSDLFCLGMKISFTP